MADDSNAPPADGAAFSFHGKDYYIPRLIQADKKAFTVWCCARASQAVDDMRPMIAEGVITRQRWDSDAALTHQRITAGFYWFDEPGGAQARMTDAGLAYLCWLCMKRHDKEILLATVAEMATQPDEQFGTLLLKQFLRANADPTVPRPTGDGGGENSTLGSHEKKDSAATASTA